MIKLIVFDFDGTLVDTREMIENVLKDILGKYGYKPADKIFRFLGDSPIEGFLKHIISDKGNLKKISLEFVLRKNKNYKQAKLIKDILKLKKIKQKKIILSNNLTFFIKRVLKNLKIDFFDEIYGADKFKNKYDKFKKILEKYNLKPFQVIYVGDRPVDILLAKKVGCISVAISHKASWSKKKELLKAEPNF